MAKSSSATAVPLAVTHADGSGGRLRTIAGVTALVGGPLFLLGVILHPARDGQGIAEAGGLYGLTHDVQAIGLLLQAISLAGMLAFGMHAFGRRGPLVWCAALIGTLSWLGLIVYDGSHNPVMARYAPAVVHTHADLDAGGAVIVLPALLLFPLGYVLLAVLLSRHGMRWPALLLGAGAVLYTAGGLLIFVLGPHSPFVQIFEVAGAVPYALGFVLLGRIRWRSEDTAG
ncbi:hypothetical protein [Streptosporangium roseum]|uniref:hypothetical protein n=1 Tax=Streptosporangium roseum TaxID=2001 RepID=UPI0004CD4AA5|nr:hypothetical protein [Streptosporangium roseum]